MSKNEIPQSARRKMESLLALSRSENESESGNALTALNKLLLKHWVSIEDIDPLKVKYFEFSFATKWEERLLLQIVSMVKDAFRDGYYKPRPKTVMVELTAVQGIEVERLYRHYRKAWKEEIEVFYGAFIQKNKIFGNYSDDDMVDYVSPTNEEQMRKMAMSEGIRKVNAFRELE